MLEDYAGYGERLAFVDNFILKWVLVGTVFYLIRGIDLLTVCYRLVLGHWRITSLEYLVYFLLRPAEGSLIFPFLGDDS